MSAVSLSLSFSRSRARRRRRVKSSGDTSGARNMRTNCDALRGELNHRGRVGILSRPVCVRAGERTSGYVCARSVARASLLGCINLRRSGDGKEGDGNNIVISRACWQQRRCVFHFLYITLDARKTITRDRANATSI